ncbi:MAG: PhnD/SsuA/transferrin family substrate-binding protein [Bacillota bacterium]|uniref:PhnD/SsuA/transferrin family substrate-binding protein n=1 Tax=Virgibacillus TaxID=84406 RepID=UPI0004017E7E|nr:MULTISPECIES: PhnD/SsuA/transferrin family substrate-binding protein [Bacillaceae]MCC2249423.1 PhnD/SsuA/transferrin family substrate-binding protein [Virgibacillus sp. AGTR]MDY7045041.1 PhnD/SsuA/transferrin family substrate-binding protein [Virgibacillus sp. M23]QRZ18787.1 PhnD/SsuA/transferrin family substrate-binding protein [Virgibacillus sp. AGTR]WBX81637.1 PhnD/SsuA/transferrin family substrate-binding protein [Virgibacillus salarius]
MKKTITRIAVLLLLAIAAVGCSTGNANGEAEVDDVIDIVWYPNESGEDLKSSRDEIGKVIADATGKEVEHHLTTDYAIAIETLVNNNADVAFMGAQGYIEANKSNDAIQPLVVPTGPSGTLDDAVYHSWLAVNIDDQENYKKDGEFSLDTIADKKFSFVSNSSTSGFKVPSSSILAHFTEQDEYADLTEEDLMEAGPLFSQVLFGNSHQGSAVNLLSGNADVAAFCDTCVENYVEVAEGEENTVGSVYRVKDDAAEPFNKVTDSEFTLMSVTPVLNAPFAANMDTLGEEDYKKLQEVLTSDEVANNQGIFVPEDSEDSALFFKSDKERFAPVEDAWFDPIREISK